MSISRCWVLALLLSLSACAQDKMTAEEQTAQWAIAFFDSFNRDLSPGDLDSWMANWAENAERITPMGDAHGKEHIRRLYEDLNRRYRNMNQEIVGLIVQGNRASVELMTLGIHRATGVEVSMPNVAVLKFTPSGKVVSAHVYLDMKNVERQLQSH